MPDFQIDPEQPIAWRGVPQDTPVRTSDGKTVGTVYDLLGSQDEDIFPGIVVHLGRFGHQVLVPAAQVTLLTTSHVDVTLTSKEIHALPEHAGEEGYHLGMTGLFRRRLGWVKDKNR